MLNLGWCTSTPNILDIWEQCARSYKKYLVEEEEEPVFVTRPFSIIQLLWVRFCL